jgi:hypothetical protein
MFAASAQAAVTFQPALHYDTTFSSGAGGVETADVNRDGRLDVIVAERFSDTVAVFLGNGDGTLGARHSFSAGPGPVDIAVGDLNRDGKPDLAIADASDLSFGEVTILRGNGDGTFDLIDHHVTGFGTDGVVIADFDRDGKLDVAATTGSATAFQDNLAFLRGNGDGTVTEPTYTDVRAFPSSLAAGDLNRDGIQDLVLEAESVTIDNGGIYVLRGRGDGTFATPVEYLGAAKPASVRLADVDRDSRLDIVATALIGGSRRLVVLPGTGTGAFGAPVTSNSATDLRALSIADVNRDGLPDVVGTRSGSADVQVAVGIGSRRFAAPHPVPAGLQDSRATATGDLDNDGRIDVLASDFLLDQVVVLRNATPKPGPKTKEDCKRSGWRAFGFRNQGLCVSSLRAGRR